MCFVNRRHLSCCRSCRLSSQHCPLTGKLLLWSLPRAPNGEQRHHLDRKLKRNNTTSIDQLTVVVPKIVIVVFRQHNFLFGKATVQPIMSLCYTRDVFQTDGNRVSAATVASTAIAAAQWAVTQVTLLCLYVCMSTLYCPLYVFRLGLIV